MRRPYVLTCIGLLALLAVQSPGSAQERDETRGFTIAVDGVKVEINPGEKVQATLKDGRTVSVELTRNPFSRWSDAMLSFDYPSGLTVATQKLSKSITQHMVASAVGTVIIVQEYEDLDPTALKQLMLNELTKNEVKAGATFMQSETAKKLPSGIELAGLQGTLQTRSEIKTIDVLSYGKDGQGILLVSVISDEYRPTDQAIIDKFWGTLALKF